MKNIIDETLFRGFHPDKDGEETVIIDGKKIKGTWYYGDLLRDFTSGIFAIVIYVNLGGDIQDLSEINIFKVIPETVGQYTGLTDKNGRKIFEGDIVKIPLYEGCQEKAIAVVDWDIICAVFYLHGKRVNTDFYHYFGNDCEVIGNIYDNPESEVTND